jgi:GNAT superfamily N-acetyltransferase
METIRHLGPDEVDAAGELLARAFFDDPMAAYMLPDARSRGRLLAVHMGAMIRYGVLYGEVHATPGALRGVAMWAPPGLDDVSPEQAAASGIDRAADELGAEAWGRFLAVMDHVGQFRTRDVPEPHWYLALIGVAPEAAGQGLGGGLLRPTVERADATRTPCYLETANPRNVPFYGRHGFDLVREGVNPGSRVRYWTFRHRPPRRREPG